MKIVAAVVKRQDDVLAIGFALMGDTREQVIDEVTGRNSEWSVFSDAFDSVEIDDLPRTTVTMHGLPFNAAVLPEGHRLRSLVEGA